MKNKQPLVSVVIPCYNHEMFVKDSIQSVIDQNYDNIELIIIDDGSKDCSVLKIKEMIEICEQRFVRFEFRSRANIGLSATLNEALYWSKGKYFSAIASDDLMLNSKTSIQVSYMENMPYTSALFGSADYINEIGKIKINDSLQEQEYKFEDILLNECMFYAPTQMLRLDMVKEVGGYNPNILVEDWYMWLKLAERGKVYCLSDKLALYRIHSSNITRDSQFIYENNLKTLEFYKNHKLYDKAYAKLRWTNITWVAQKDRVKSLNLLSRYIIEHPKHLFNKGFLIYSKYFFIKMKNWS